LKKEFASSIFSSILFLSSLISFRFAFSSSALYVYVFSGLFCDTSRITLKQYIKKTRDHKIDHVE